MGKYSGKGILFLWISLCLLVGCGAKDMPGHVVTEGETTEPEMTRAAKPISEYKDCREVVPNTYVPEGDYEICENNIYGCYSEWDYNVEELCANFSGNANKSIIVGEVVGDICYGGSWSELTPMDGLGVTYYTFAVTEVLHGNLVEAENLITVEEQQGYVKAPDRDDLYCYTHCGGSPAVQIGDKYVLFLDMPKTAPDGEGYIYDGVWFMNKYFLCEDGLYRRYTSELNGFAYVDKVTGKMVNAEALTLDELKTAILNELNHVKDPVVNLVKDETETIIRAVPVDFEGDNAPEHLEIVARGNIDVSDSESVREFVAEGGTIIVRLRQDNGELIDYSDAVLNRLEGCNGQYFLINCDGKERILYTSTYEDRWRGSIMAAIKTIRSTRVDDYRFFGSDNDYEIYSDYFVKMKKNPMDLPEETRSAKVDGFREFLEPYLADAELLIAVDCNWEELIMYSTENNKVSGAAYFDDYWQREETFVDDGRFYK